MDLADLVDNIPTGSPLWISVGGPRAWSEQTAITVMLELRLRELAWMQSEDGRRGRNRPERMAYPKSWFESAAEEAVVTRRAEKFLARQRRRGDS